MPGAVPLNLLICGSRLGAVVPSTGALELPLTPISSKAEVPGTETLEFLLLYSLLRGSEAMELRVPQD